MASTIINSYDDDDLNQDDDDADFNNSQQGEDLQEDGSASQEDGSASQVKFPVTVRQLKKKRSCSQLARLEALNGRVRKDCELCGTQHWCTGVPAPTDNPIPRLRIGETDKPLHLLLQSMQNKVPASYHRCARGKQSPCLAWFLL